MTTAKEPLTRPKSSSFFKSIVSKLKPKRNPAVPASKPSDKINSDRCDFTFSDGRQCRTPRAQYCVHHEIRKGRTPGDEVAPDAALVGLCGDLTTATNINRALAQTFLLMAQGRISQKQAVAFGYLSQLLLQTVPGIRSEFVSAFGYRQWEKRLKHSLDPNSDIDPAPSSGGDGQSEPADPDDSYDDENESDESTVPEDVTEPDYGSLYLRTLDLFDRKYDTTPEGRHEADKLALELELLNPNPGKPPGGHFGRVVDLVRRMQAAEGGHPSRMPVPSEQREPREPSVTSCKNDQAATATASSHRFSHSNASSSIAVPAASVQPLASTEPADPTEAISYDPQVIPPVHRPPSDRPSQPFSFDFFQAPNASAPEPLPDPLNVPPRSDGHTSDWYAPPSWSKTRTPDPLPSRQEKIKRKLRGMCNSKLRRLQHLNSRSF
jgi:hypothetical protein